MNAHEVRVLTDDVDAVCGAAIIEQRPHQTSIHVGNPVPYEGLNPRFQSQLSYSCSFSMSDVLVMNTPGAETEETAYELRKVSCRET